MITINSYLLYQNDHLVPLEEAKIPILGSERDEIPGSFDFVVDGKTLLSREEICYLDWDWSEFLNAVEALLDPSILFYSNDEKTEEFHRVSPALMARPLVLDFIFWREDERMEVVRRDTEKDSRVSASLPAREFYDTLLDGAELFFEKMKKLAPKHDFQYQLDTIDRIDRRAMRYPLEDFDFPFFMPGDIFEDQFE